MGKIILSIGAVVIYLCCGLSQMQAQQKNDISLNISFIKEDTKLPSGKTFTDPFHPGILLGLDWQMKNFENSHLTGGVEFAYYFREKFQQGILLNLASGYNYIIPNGILLHAGAKIGFLNTFSVGEQYTTNSQGVEEKLADWNRTKLFPGLGAGLGYSLHGQQIFPLDVVFKYYYNLDYPFVPEIDSYIFPRSFIQLETKWYIRKWHWN